MQDTAATVRTYEDGYSRGFNDAIAVVQACAEHSTRGGECTLWDCVDRLRDKLKEETERASRQTIPAPGGQ